MKYLKITEKKEDSSNVYSLLLEIKEELRVLNQKQFSKVELSQKVL